MKIILYVACWTVFLFLGISAQETITDSDDTRNQMFLSADLVEGLFLDLQENASTIPTYFKTVRVLLLSENVKNVALPPSYFQDVYLIRYDLIYQAVEAFIAYLENPTQAAMASFVSKFDNFEEQLEFLTMDFIRDDYNLLETMLDSTERGHEAFLNASEAYMSLMNAAVSVYAPYCLFTKIKEPADIAEMYTNYIDVGQYLTDKIQYVAYKCMNAEHVDSILQDHLETQREYNDSVVSLTSADLLNSKDNSRRWITLVLKESPEEMKSSAHNDALCNNAFDNTFNTALLDDRRILAFSTDTLSLDSYNEEMFADVINGVNNTAEMIFDRLTTVVNNTSINEFIGGNTLIVYSCNGVMNDTITDYETKIFVTADNYTILLLPPRTDQRPVPDPVPTSYEPNLNEEIYDYILSFMYDVIQNTTSENSEDDVVRISGSAAMQGLKKDVENNPASNGVVSSLNNMVCISASVIYLYTCWNLRYF